MSNNQESNQNQQLTDEEQQYLLKCHNEYCKSLSYTTPPMNSYQETNSSFARSITTTNLGQATLMAAAKTSKYTAIWKIDGGLLFTAKDMLSYLTNLKAQNGGKHINNAKVVVCSNAICTLD